MPEDKVSPKAQWTPIDLNRGVTLRQDKESGTQVYMYKDDPGHYYSQFGKPLPIAMAEKAGFPVELHKKERQRKERRAFASKEIDKELEMADKTKPAILQTRGEFQIIDKGLGRGDVIDVDGNTYNPQPLPLAAAERLLTAMAGQAVPLNPQEVLVARKKHDAYERVREGYDKEIDVEGVGEVIGGKGKPSVWREGHEVDPAVQESEKRFLGPPEVAPTIPSDAERAEKARLKAENPNAPNAKPVGFMGAKVLPKAEPKTYDDPNVYQGGKFSEPPNKSSSEVFVPQAKVRSLG